MNIIASSHDAGLQPVHRILAENSVVPLEEFHVVPDADQITASHHLVLPRRHFASFGDHVAAGFELPPMEYIGHSIGLTDWVWLERGRAKFCTSMNTAAHAHAHILSAADLQPACLTHLASCLRVSQHTSMGEALNQVLHLDSEYLLFGSPKGSWFVALPPNECFAQKRFIRNYLNSKIVTH